MMVFIVSILVACAAGEFLRPIEKLVAWLSKKREDGKI